MFDDHARPGNAAPAAPAAIKSIAPSFGAGVRAPSDLRFARPSARTAETAPKIAVENVDFWYGEKQALKAIDLEIFPRETTAFIGPSGCGKTTLLRCLNRMNDEIRDVRMTGRITLDGVDVNGADIDPPQIRRRFGWVAQKPNPFPWSVYENIAYAPRIHGLVEGRADLEARVEQCLRRAGLWDELKDRLREPGVDLSGGQQQRLCIARALSVDPEVLLMDEPCGSLDPISTETIEQLILELSETVSIVIVTHNMEQAARVSQRTAFFKLGEMLEANDTRALFLSPQHPACQAYLDGKFG